MRPKLLVSTVIVVAFWFIVTTIYWSFQRPEVNYQALLSLASLAQSIGLGSWVTAVQYDPNIFGSLGVQKAVLLRWSFPVLLLVAVSAAVGYGLTWHLARESSRERDAREKGQGNFRGVKLTVGILPMPRKYLCDEVELSGQGNSHLDKLSPKEMAVLNQIMGTISANEEGAALPTGASSLVDYTLQRLSAFFEESTQGPIEYFGLSTLAIAAMQLGYVNAYTKGPNNTWRQNGNKTHAGESGAILAGLSSWDELDYTDKQALYLSVKYNLDAKKVPDIQGDTTIGPIAKVIIAQTQTFGAVPLTAPVKAEAKKKDEKVVTLDNFGGPSKDALEDAAYVLPGQGNDEEGAPAPAVVPDVDHEEEGGRFPSHVPTPAPAPVAAPAAPASAPPAPAAPAPAPQSVASVVAPKPATPAPAKPAPAAEPVAKPQPMPKAPVAQPAQGNPSSAGGSGNKPRATAPTVVPVVSAEIEKEVVDTFVRILPSLAFQDRGLPKAVKAVAWKVKGRVYMLEIQLREKMLEALSEEARALLRDTSKGPKARVQPLTALMFKLFNDRGWLVKNINEVTVSEKEAMWNIIAGTKPFNGVIVLDLPEDLQPLLPTRDSMYEVKVEGPLYLSTASGHRRGGDNSDDGHPGGRGPGKKPAASVQTSLKGILG